MTKHFQSHWLVPAGLLLIGSIAVISGIIRLTALGDALTTGIIPDAPEGLEHYVEFPLISLLHLIPGMLFLLLGPLQFTPVLRHRWPRLHRWSGRAVVVCGMLTGIGAIIMAFVFPVIVNQLSTVANITMGSALIGALIIALRAILRGDVPCHRAWMIRAYAVGLTPAVMRLLFSGIIFSVGEGFMDNIPVMIWVTFIADIAIAEAILCYTGLRKHQLLPNSV